MVLLGTVRETEGGEDPGLPTSMRLTHKTAETASFSEGVRESMDLPWVSKGKRDGDKNTEHFTTCQDIP